MDLAEIIHSRQRHLGYTRVAQHLVPNLTLSQLWPGSCFVSQPPLFF